MNKGSIKGFANGSNSNNEDILDKKCEFEHNLCIPAQLFLFGKAIFFLFIIKRRSYDAQFEALILL